MTVLTTHGEMDESALIKREDVIDNDHERTVCVEYCLATCGGQAHTTGVPDAASHFCHQHVHRSVAVELKEWPDGIGTILGDFQ